MDDVTNRPMPPDDAPAAGVEALLRAAARFTPDAPPVPDALALRALERAGLLPGTSRPRRTSGLRPFVLSGGAFAGALGAGALVWLTLTAGPPAVTALPARTLSTEREASAPLPRDGVPKPAPGDAATAAGAFVAQAVSETMPARSVPSARRPAAAAAPARVRREWRAAPRTLASFRRRGRARRPVFASVSPPPKALWRTQTVEQENYGVLAPAWVTFHAPPAEDAADGAQGEGEIVGAVPVVVDLPLSGGDTHVVAAADIVPVDYNPHHPQGEFR